MSKPTLDELLRRQESGTLTPAQAARLFSGHDNRRTGFYGKCWLRHLQLVAEKRYRRSRTRRP